VLNYEGAFLRAAARALSATGRMSDVRLYSSMIEQTITSMVNRIDTASDKDSFTDDVADATFDDVGWVSSDDELLQHISSIVVLAQERNAATDSASVLQAAETVIKWVRTDISGQHRVIAPRRKEVRPRHVRAPSNVSSGSAVNTPAEGSAHVTDKSVLDMVITIPDRIIGEDIVNETILSEESPEDVFQWMFDKPGALDKVCDRSRNIHAFYDEITHSAREYAEFLEVAKSVVDFSEYERPDVSMFPHVSFEDDGGNAVME